MRRAAYRRATLATIAITLAGCAGAPVRPAAPPAAEPAPTPVAPAMAAPAEPTPRPSDPELLALPDATPRAEARAQLGNPPFYEVFGQRYTVLESSRGYLERGVASWYGPDFHGVRTSIGEPYDMYSMTAAHKTLPLPAYARVTNLRNGHSVVVRLNDRGPFKANRIIDLSYAAALKLDMVRDGTTLVEVRALEADGPAPPPPPPSEIYAQAEHLVEGWIAELRTGLGPGGRVRQCQELRVARPRRRLGWRGHRRRDRRRRRLRRRRCGRSHGRTGAAGQRDCDRGERRAAVGGASHRGASGACVGGVRPVRRAASPAAPAASRRPTACARRGVGAGRRVGTDRAASSAAASAYIAPRL